MLNKILPKVSFISDFSFFVEHFLCLIVYKNTVLSKKSVNIWFWWVLINATLWFNYIYLHQHAQSISCQFHCQMTVRNVIYFYLPAWVHSTQTSISAALLGKKGKIGVKLFFCLYNAFICHCCLCSWDNCPVLWPDASQTSTGWPHALMQRSLWWTRWLIQTEILLLQNQLNIKFPSPQNPWNEVGTKTGWIPFFEQSSMWTPAGHLYCGRVGRLFWLEVSQE